MSWIQKSENDIAVKKELLRFEPVANNYARCQHIIEQIKNFEGEHGTTWRYEQARIWFCGRDFSDHFTEIISLLEFNLHTAPEDNDSRLLLAMAYEKAGLNDLAINTFRDALNRSPRDLKIMIPAVAALFKAAQYDEADKLLKSVGQYWRHPVLRGYEAQNYLQQGQFESAVEILKELRTSQSDNDSVDLFFAYAQMRNNNFAQAKDVLAKLKERRPDSFAVLAAVIELNVRCGRTADAITLCDDEITKTRSARAYMLRARTYQLFGKNGLAQQDYEYAASIEPDNSQAWIALAQFCTTRGLTRQAASAWEKSVKLNSQNTYIREQALTFLFSKADSQMNQCAEKIINDALSANPNDQRLQIWLARSLLLKETAPDVDKAIEILTKAAENASAEADVWGLLCQAWLNKNEPSKALDVILRGLAILPDNKELLLLKAHSEAAHKPELAIPTVKLLNEKDPEDANLAIYLSSLYVQAGEYEAALKVLENQPSHFDPNTERKINVVRAAAFYKSGDREQARKLYESLSVSYPYDSEIMLAKAHILINEEKWNELSEYADNCRTNPDDVKSILEIIKAMPVNKNAVAAEISQKILRRMIIADPGSTELINELAVLLQISGNFTEAAQFYGKLIELEPDNIIAINNLAWIMCEEQGKCYASP